MGRDAHEEESARLNRLIGPFVIIWNKQAPYETESLDAPLYTGPHLSDDAHDIIIAYRDADIERIENLPETPGDPRQILMFDEEPLFSQAEIKERQNIVTNGWGRGSDVGDVMYYDEGLVHGTGEPAIAGDWNDETASAYQMFRARYRGYILPGFHIRTQGNDALGSLASMRRVISRLPSILEQRLQTAGYDTPWNDSLSQCEACQKAIEQDNYSHASIYIATMGDICRPCLEDNPYDYIEALKEDPHETAEEGLIDLDGEGYTQVAALSDASRSSHIRTLNDTLDLRGQYLFEQDTRARVTLWIELDELVYWMENQIDYLDLDDDRLRGEPPGISMTQYHELAQDYIQAVLQASPGTEVDLKSMVEERFYYPRR